MSSLITKELYSDEMVAHLETVLIEKLKYKELSPV